MSTNGNDESAPTKPRTTVLTVSDLYPSTEALESGSTGALPETLDQLEAFLNSPEANTTG